MKNTWEKGSIGTCANNLLFSLMDHSVPRKSRTGYDISWQKSRFSLSSLSLFHAERGSDQFPPLVTDTSVTCDIHDIYVQYCWVNAHMLTCWISPILAFAGSTFLVPCNNIHVEVVDGFRTRPDDVDLHVLCCTSSHMSYVMECQIPSRIKYEKQQSFGQRQKPVYILHISIFHFLPMISTHHLDGLPISFLFSWKDNGTMHQIFLRRWQLPFPPSIWPKKKVTQTHLGRKRRDWCARTSVGWSVTQRPGATRSLLAVNLSALQQAHAARGWTLYIIYVRHMGSVHQNRMTFKTPFHPSPWSLTLSNKSSYTAK